MISAGHDRTGRFSWSSLRDTMGTPTQMIDTKPSSAVSREGHPTDRPSSTPVGVQGPEDHSVDQAVTAALKSLVRSTLKAPSYIDDEKLSDSARTTAFKRSLPAVRAHLLQTATGSSLVKGAPSSKTAPGKNEHPPPTPACMGSPCAAPRQPRVSWVDVVFGYFRPSGFSKQTSLVPLES